MVVRTRGWCCVLVVLLSALGCSARISTSTTVLPASTLSPTPAATSTRMSSPGVTMTATPTASSTPTASRTATATATVTDTPSPTPTLPHPLDIQWMRRQAYPGSDLVLEKELATGSNYDRAIVSYLSEGLKIYAYMTVPQGTPPEDGWPVVVFNHGYIPPDEYRSTERYVAYVDAFARWGYIVFRSDYRGHGDSEGESSGGSRTADYTIDVLNGMASVMRHPAADPDRVGMWGHSMGGGITLRAMVISPDIKSGVIWAGMVAKYPDILSFYTRRMAPTPSGGAATPTSLHAWAQAWLDENKDDDDSHAFWSAISPNSYLADLSGPISIHHGDADAVVPLDYSLDLAAQMEQAGMPFELHTYEGDDHNISGNWGTAMTRSVAFMDEHVKWSR